MEDKGVYKDNIQNEASLRNKLLKYACLIVSCAADRRRSRSTRCWRSRTSCRTTTWSCSPASSSSS